jgi:hypothetical protein
MGKFDFSRPRGRGNSLSRPEIRVPVWRRFMALRPSVIFESESQNQEFDQTISLRGGDFCRSDGTVAPCVLGRATGCNCVGARCPPETADPPTRTESSAVHAATLAPVIRGTAPPLSLMVASSFVPPLLLALSASSTSSSQYSSLDNNVSLVLLEPCTPRARFLHCLLWWFSDQGVRGAWSRRRRRSRGTTDGGVLCRRGPRRRPG